MTDKLNRNQQPQLSEHDAELLSAYIDDMLPRDEQDILEERLQNNLFLRQELAAMRQTVTWLNALPTLKAPRNFSISAEDVAPIPAKVIPMPKQNWWFAASSAAILIVIIGLAAILPNISNQSPASDGDSAEQVALFSTSPAIADEDTTTGVDTADASDAFTAESDFADESAVGSISAEAPPASEISRSADNETQAQEAPTDMNNRSITAQPALANMGQGSGAENLSQTEPQEAETMSDMASDTDEAVEADTMPNTNIAASSVMQESSSDDAVEEAEADNSQDLGLMDTQGSPEELTADVIRSILEALRRFLEALQA